MKRTNFEKQLEDCSGIITFLAIQTWKKLPRWQKDAVEVEDLVQEGKLFVWNGVLKQWNRNKGQKLTTWVYTCLKQHYINETLASYRKKKIPRKTNLPEVIVPQPVLEAAEAYGILYSLCSYELKGYLAGTVGMLEPDVEIRIPQRYRLKGKRWNRVKNEFRGVLETVQALGMSITLDDLELLQKQGMEYLYQ